MPDSRQLRFDEQRENEEVLILTRCHWWAFARTAWLPLLAMIAIWVAAALIETPLGRGLMFLLSLLLPGLALLYFYREWRNDAVIVTDQRIIHISRAILTMRRQITEINLESVHEINFEIPPSNPFARLFSYGTVIIKTAGAQGNLELDLIPKPKQFQQLVLEERQHYESRQAEQRHELLRAELQGWMAGETADHGHQPDTAQPPQPKPGTNSYLSARIEMTNGDIVYRKHLSVWAQHTIIPMALMVFSLILLLLTFTLVSENMRVLTFPLGLVTLLIGGVAYYWVDWDWRNDYYVISDDTITLVHQRPLFLQNLRDQILLERIDNVESASNGFWAAMMKYGDVRMSLVGADEHKMFHRVPNPQEIQQEISRRRHNIARRRSRDEAWQQRQILGEYLDALNGQPAAPEQDESFEEADAPPVDVDVDGPNDSDSAPRPTADKPTTLPAAFDHPPLPFRPKRGRT